MPSNSITFSAPRHKVLVSPCYSEAQNLRTAIKAMFVQTILPSDNSPQGCLEPFCPAQVRFLTTHHPLVPPSPGWCETTLLLREALRCKAVELNAEAQLCLWSIFQTDRPGIDWSRVWSRFVLRWWCRTYDIA